MKLLRSLKYGLLFYFGILCGCSTTDQASPAEVPAKPESQLYTSPHTPENPLRVSEFPALNQPFEFAGMQYQFISVNIKKVRFDHHLTIGVEIFCPKTDEPCFREKKFIDVDGETYIIRSEENIGAVHPSTSKRAKFVFVLPSYGENYQIRLLRRPEEWVHDFKVLRE
ncbi:MAG: hypothetical protein AAGJ82_01325 [Bacteroidota bacterium]